MESNHVTETIIDSMMRLPSFLRKNLLKPVFESLGCEISHHHFIILKFLGELGPKPVSAIGRCADISKPEMTLLSDRLNELGFIERQPDLSDRRITNLAVTQKGQDFLKESRKLIRKGLKDKLSSLDAQELNELALLLSRLSELASKIS